MSTSTNETNRDPNKSCIIAKGTLIKGNIKTTEDIRVDGEINGEIKTTGRVIIGVNGKIDGIIDSNSIVNSGFLKSGNIMAESFTLTSSGKIEGELKTKNLVVESGGTFNGVSSMEKK